MLWRASDVHGTAIEATDGSIGSVDEKCKRQLDKHNKCEKFKE